jgi:hypothetical protein
LPPAGSKEFGGVVSEDSLAILLLDVTQKAKDDGTATAVPSKFAQCVIDLKSWDAPLCQGFDIAPVLRLIALTTLNCVIFRIRN